ncbi:MAG: hypothetical protein NTW10_07100 [Bacteroidetes bacterium]|nr:hypothetical protein [Bacteroidota bacterium]
MKNRYFFFLILLVAMTACKKNGSDGLPLSFIAGGCRILTMSTAYTGNPSFSRFYYNEFGKLLYADGTSYTGDTTIGRQYHYTGDVLNYSWFSSSSNSSDTIFYYYDGDKRISRTAEHNWTDTLLLSTITDFHYNQAGQVIHTLALSVMNNQFSRVDSAFFTYTGNNVTRYLMYERDAYGSVNGFSIDISYDSMKNFYKAMGMPPDMFYFWSENNITEIKYADSADFAMSFIYSKYNPSGYPAEFLQIDRTSPPDTMKAVITYQCK